PHSAQLSDVHPFPTRRSSDLLWPPEELARLLAVSDFVVIAAPHTPRTVKLFRREQFQQMKPTAYLINIGSWLHLLELLAAKQLQDRKSTRLNSSHLVISYAVF